MALSHLPHLRDELERTVMLRPNRAARNRAEGRRKDLKKSNLQKTAPVLKPSSADDFNFLDACGEPGELDDYLGTLESLGLDLIGGDSRNLYQHSYKAEDTSGVEYHPFLDTFIDWLSEEFRTSELTGLMRGEVSQEIFGKSELKDFFSLYEEIIGKKLTIRGRVHRGLQISDFVEYESSPDDDDEDFDMAEQQSEFAQLMSDSDDDDDEPSSPSKRQRLDSE